MFAPACMYFLPIILTYNKLIKFRNHPNKTVYCCCKQKVVFLVICKCIIASWLASNKWKPKCTLKILWSHGSPSPLVLMPMCTLKCMYSAQVLQFRPEPIMLFKLPIMLLSNAPKFSLLRPNYAQLWPIVLLIKRTSIVT